MPVLASSARVVRLLPIRSVSGQHAENTFSFRGNTHYCAPAGGRHLHNAFFFVRPSRVQPADCQKVTCFSPTRERRAPSCIAGAFHWSHPTRMMTLEWCHHCGTPMTHGPEVRWWSHSEFSHHVFELKLLWLVLHCPTSMAAARGQAQRHLVQNTTSDMYLYSSRLP